MKGELKRERGFITPFPWKEWDGEGEGGGGGLLEGLPNLFININGH